MRFIDDGSEVTTFEEPKINERLVHTKHGFTIKLERTDPYGFIYIRWHSGPTPEEISGAYSDFMLARQALNSYLEKYTFNKLVDEKPEYTKAVYKKKYRKTEEVNDS